MRIQNFLRFNSLDNARPERLIDNHSRPITYVRLSVTDFCNLRCVYCMAEEGVPRVPHHEILSLEELARLVHLLAELGISKVRVTGGEPFVRRGLMHLLHQIKRTPGVKTLYITTNGVAVRPYLRELKQLDISGINLSLDTLNRARFLQITRRDELDQVLKTLHDIVALDIPLKVNSVVMDGLNTDDILPLSRLSKDAPIDVRFIEEMPFNGQASTAHNATWTATRILQKLQSAYPDIQPIPTKFNSTAQMYAISGYRGRVGIIAGLSRTFCGTCNRLRITAQGMLKTCLYDQGVCDLKCLLRSGASDAYVQAVIRQVVTQRTRDGIETHKRYRRLQGVTESMALIGG